ncbi:unnamed protein product [Cuscuta campestris]|uniref:CCHC-type domain-containing protein n=1 Tax=Cuscuta campestris TaxID=132261 RepID=A0A484MM73_9ASTE|nr:unnamed protein product [Cuscuta campestris]
MTLPEYRQKFTKLAKFAPTLVNTPTDRIEEFRKKLRPDLRSCVSILTTVDFAEAYDLIARADSDLSACIEYLKTNNVSSSTHRPTGSASKGKRPFQEPSNSHFSKKGKSVQTQSMASVDKSKKRRYPACEHCERNHPGECWLKQGLCLGCGKPRHFRKECPTNPGEPYPPAPVTYLEMIAAQELSEFLHIELHSKYEDEVLQFYKNGEVRTVQSKKNPQRTIQVIESTVEGSKVGISQKKLKKKLHLPNSGSEIGRLPSKNLDWKTIGIFEQIPSGPAKKADLKNDYKLVLELIIACLECGSGGHADDITQEKAFIINALITRTKCVIYVIYCLRAYYTCNVRLCLFSFLFCFGYWLYYLSSKGENRASSTAEEESSSDNVLIVSLKKSSKRKHVVSPSPSAEAPQNLALVNLDEEQEVPAHGELQKKKKRRISSSSTSGNANPDDLVEKEPFEEASAHNQSPQQLDEDEEIPQDQNQLLEWDQQLKNDKKTYGDLHLEYLATSQTSEFEADDEDPAVYKPIFSKPTEDQMVLTTEAQAHMEATAEDFQVFLETSPAFEIVLPEENVATPLQEQNQEKSEEELQQFLQSQVLEILTTPCEISKSTELEISEKSIENLEKSTPPETNEALQEDPAVEVQRSFAEAEGEAQIARLEATETPVAIFEQPAEDEDRDSLSKDISNFVNDETEEESVKTLKIDEEEAEQGDAESLPLQLFHRVPSSQQLTNFHFYSSSASTLPDEILETWTRKVQGLIESALESQHASFRQEIEQMEARHNKLMEKSEEKYCSNLNEISKFVDKTLEIISLFSKSVSNTMEAYACDCHLQFKEATAIKQQIATVTQSNPENSIQHLSNTGFDGSEAAGTIASHFTSDAQTEERYNNLKRIQEECGVMQGIGEAAGSSKRKKK